MKMNQSLLSMDWNLLFTIVTVLVLFVILKHFFFEKVHKVMEDREKYVNDTISNAEEKDRQAEEKLALYNAQLATAEDEGRKIIKNARDEAKSQAKEIIDEADTMMREADELSRRSSKTVEIAQNNLDINARTINLAQLYEDHLKSRWVALDTLKREMRLNFALARNTFRTIKVGGELIEVIH